MLLIIFCWTSDTNLCLKITFLNFRMEAYSAAVGSWMARELTEDRGDLLIPLAPLPLPVIGPLMVPFPLPFPLPPCEETHKVTCQLQTTYCHTFTNFHEQGNTEATVAKQPERGQANVIQRQSCSSCTLDLCKQLTYHLQAKKNSYSRYINLMTASAGDNFLSRHV